MSEGRDLLTAYYHKLPDDEYKVIAIEEPFVFYLPELTIPIIGFIDLMEEDDSGTIIITDWKTAGRAYSTDEIDGKFSIDTLSDRPGKNSLEKRHSPSPGLSHQNQTAQVRAVLHRKKRFGQKAGDQDHHRSLERDRKGSVHSKQLRKMEMQRLRLSVPL